jgi:hypothetical protein
MPTAKLPHLQGSLSMRHMHAQVGLHGLMIELLVSSHSDDISVRAHKAAQ